MRADEFLPYWAGASGPSARLHSQTSSRPRDVRGPRRARARLRSRRAEPVAARGGARVLATDWAVDALASFARERRAQRRQRFRDAPARLARARRARDVRPRARGGRPLRTALRRRARRPAVAARRRGACSRILTSLPASVPRKRRPGVWRSAPRVYAPLTPPLMRHARHAVSLSSRRSARYVSSPGVRGTFRCSKRLLGDPAMTEHLGGPESHEQLCRAPGPVTSAWPTRGTDVHVFKIVDAATESPSCTVGYWEKSRRDRTVHEDRVVRAARAPRDAASRASAPHRRSTQLGRNGATATCTRFRSVDNHPPNAICRRKLGFTLLEECDFEYPEGQPDPPHHWRFDLGALSAQGEARQLPARARRGGRRACRLSTHEADSAAASVAACGLTAMPRGIPRGRLREHGGRCE